MFLLNLLEEEERKKRALLDPKTLTWLPWFWHMSWLSGSTLLSYCDHYGEKLAWFFGITSPKYYWEIEEFKKMQEEEKERKKKEKEENFGWSEKDRETDEVKAEQPKLATLDPAHLKEPAIRYQAQTNCDEQVKVELESNF